VEEEAVRKTRGRGGKDSRSSPRTRGNESRVAAAPDVIALGAWQDLKMGCEKR